MSWGFRTAETGDRDADGDEPVPSAFSIVPLNREFLALIARKYLRRTRGHPV